MEDKRKLKTTEMRIFRMVCGKTFKDKINNEKIREMTGVERFKDFLKTAKVAMICVCGESG